MFNKEKPVELIIDREKCRRCGACTNECISYLTLDNEGFPCPKANDDCWFGCIQCGHCMMICPNNAIEIKGEDIGKENLRDFDMDSPRFISLNSLFLKRRSIRKYKKQAIPRATIDKIIDASATAAVSIPPSEVKVLVINGEEKVQEFADDIIDALKSLVKFMNPFMLAILRPFVGKATYKMFKDFVLPLSKELIEHKGNGLDYLFYNAPAVMIFYTSELSDKEDSLIAATHATLAVEALGLGSCYIGSVGAVLQMNKKLRKKYGILDGEKLGTAFILGYPDVTYNRGFQRHFNDVRVLC